MVTTPSGNHDGTVPFPFFVGCGRSGTTLLRAMFDSHPQLAVAHETYFALWLGSNRGRYETPGGFDAARFVADVERHVVPGRIEIAADALLDSLTADPPADTADALRRVYALHARGQGKDRYAEKSPMFVRYISFFAELFPEARFVHLVRDGRDVSLAFRDVDFGPSTPAAAAVHWRSQVLSGHRAGARLGPTRYRAIRYEDLVADPAAVLEPICDFLELAFEPTMLRYFERAEAVVATTSHQGYHDNLFRPPTAGLRDWRSQMASRDVARFDAIAGDALDLFGYPRSQPRPSAAIRLDASTRRAGLTVAAAAATASRRANGVVRRVVRVRERSS